MVFSKAPILSITYNLEIDNAVSMLQFRINHHQ